MTDGDAEAVTDHGGVVIDFMRPLRHRRSNSFLTEKRLRPTRLGYRNGGKNFSNYLPMTTRRS